MSSAEQGEPSGACADSITRRRLLSGAAATAAALAIPDIARPTQRASGETRNVAPIPRSRRALMAFTARGLLVNDKTKYPTLPSGWRQLFEVAASIGFTGIEFFSFSGAPSFAQAPGAEGGANPSAAQIRKWLDAAGLKAIGHYNASIVNNSAVGLTPATLDAALETAGILRQPRTGSHDATGAMRQKSEVDRVIESWNQMTLKASRAGIPIYSHAHDAPWNFLLDSAPTDAKGNFTRSSGIRVMDYFLKHTGRRWVECEMDLFWAHVAQFKYRSYTAADGSTVGDIFDPGRQIAKDPSRYPIVHAKDGIRAPKTEEGWIICPFGYGDIDIERFLKTSQIEKTNPWWSSEQDNADGGDADPQKALRDIADGYRGLSTVGRAGGRSSLLLPSSSR